jgi:Tol biopolymer transport system component
VPLVQYAPFKLVQNWSWRAILSWSWDGQLLATTAHGAPLGSEPPDSSPVFDAVITDRAGTFTAPVVSSSGIWAAPQFSPKRLRPDSQFEYGYLAYLRAREPYNSVNGQYDLVVADRDGSNPRVVFPPAGQPGIISQISGLTARDYTWSPDGRQIALIYQGNVWIVDVETLVAHQLTFDGQSRYPVWTN